MAFVEEIDASNMRKVAAIIAAGLCLRLGLSALLDPGVDEAYAMAVSRQWQLSWFDHPPMVFWWVQATRLAASIAFGDAVPVFVLRLPFVIAFTVTSVVMFDLTRRLWGAGAGIWTLLALSLAPFFVVSTGTWMVPDGPLVLFLSMAARLLVEVLFFAHSHRTRRHLWLAAGLMLGLAALSKYHAVLFAGGVAFFMMATPHRRQLAGSAPWLAAAVAIVVASPVLIWNADNQWVSILFQASRGLGRDGVNWSGFGRAILGQMAYLGPWTLVAALLTLVSQLRFDRKLNGPTAFLSSVGLPAILLFTAVPLLGGGALPHWQMPGWLFLLPVLGRGIAESWLSQSGAGFRHARRFAVTAGVLLVVAVAVAGGVRFLPPSSATLGRLGIGSFLQESVTWRGVSAGLAARGLTKIGRDGSTEARRPLVVAFHWIDASRLAETLGSQATVVVFGKDPRGFAFLSDPAEWLGRDVVIIGRPKTFEKGLNALQPLFSQIDVQPPIPIKLGGSVLFEAHVAIGRGLKTPYPLPYPRR